MKGFKLRERQAFSHYLALILESGIPLLQALTILGEQDKNLGRLCYRLRDSIKRGQSFGHALQPYPKAFDHSFISFIHLGETTGRLGDILFKLAKRDQARLALRAHLIKALLYPGLVVLTAIGLLVMMIEVVLPHFAVLFANFHAPLPWFTQMVFGMAGSLSRWGSLVVLGAGAVIVGILALMQHSPRVRKQVETLLFKLPVAGRILRYRILVMVLSSLALWQESGLSLLKGLEFLSREVPSLTYRDSLRHSLFKIRAEHSFWQSLTTQEFPLLLINMIKIGETSGNLATLLLQAENHYADALKQTISKIEILLEPILLLGVAGIVGVIMLAVYWPIFSLGNLF